MQVLINETGERRSLNMIDWMDEKDYSEALTMSVSGPGTFVFDPEQNLYCCSRSTWEWWRNFLSQHHRFSTAKKALSA